MAMEIDTDNKLREIPVSQPMFHNNFSDKVPLISTKDDDFPFEIPSSTKAIFSNNLDDFHHDHNHHDHFNIDESSQNPIMGVETGSNFDSFDAFPYGLSSATMDFCDYDIKPFVDASSHCQIIEHGQVMDNFRAEGGVGLGGYLNFPTLPRRNHPSVDMVGHNQDMALQFQDAKPLNFVVPDELSCVTASQDYQKKLVINNSNNNSKHSGDNSSNNTYNHNRAPPSGRRSSAKNRKKSSVVKGQWTAEEDRLLVQLVEQHGIRKWSLIAQMLPGRIGKQCRERWHNHLRPDIKKDTWSEEEDRVLIQAHTEIGNKWAEIAKRLPGRTENSIKNHWNATKRRQYSKRKCRSKYPRGSLLQEYMKTLNLDAPTAATATNTSTRSAARSVPEAKASVADDSAKLGIKNATAPAPAIVDSMMKFANDPTQEELDFCINDRLVPNFDFNEAMPDFDFDDKILFEDGCCNVEALLEEIPCAPVANEKNFGVDDVPIDDMAPVLVDVKVKKELDLVEMISQAQV